MVGKHNQMDTVTSIAQQRELGCYSKYSAPQINFQYHMAFPIAKGDICKQTGWKRVDKAKTNYCIAVYLEMISSLHYLRFPKNLQFLCLWVSKWLLLSELSANGSLRQLAESTFPVCLDLSQGCSEGKCSPGCPLFFLCLLRRRS